MREKLREFALWREQDSVEGMHPYIIETDLINDVYFCGETIMEIGGVMGKDVDIDMLTNQLRLYQQKHSHFNPKDLAEMKVFFHSHGYKTICTVFTGPYASFDDILVYDLSSNRFHKKEDAYKLTKTTNYLNGRKWYNMEWNNSETIVRTFPHPLQLGLHHSVFKVFDDDIADGVEYLLWICPPIVCPIEKAELLTKEGLVTRLMEFNASMPESELVDIPVYMKKLEDMKYSV